MNISTKSAEVKHRLEAAKIKAALDVRDFYRHETGAKTLQTNGADSIKLPCPFKAHSSKDSLHVKLSKGFFYCHACKNGGDAVGMVQLKYGLNFKSALEKIVTDHLGGNVQAYLSTKPPERPATTAIGKTEDIAVDTYLTELIFTRALDAHYHPHLVKKGVKSYGLKVYQHNLQHNLSSDVAGFLANRDSDLMIPMFDCNGAVVSIQFVSPSGFKCNMAGRGTSGCYYVIGGQSETVGIAEGYSTAATIHERLGIQIFIAFGADNIAKVALHVHGLDSSREIIVFADNDSNQKGQNAALIAASLVNAKVLIPDCLGDFNDHPSQLNLLNSVWPSDYRPVQVLCECVGAKKVMSKIKGKGNVPSFMITLRPVEYDDDMDYVHFFNTEKRGEKYYNKRKDKLAKTYVAAFGAMDSVTVTLLFGRSFRLLNRFVGLKFMVSVISVETDKEGATYKKNRQGCTGGWRYRPRKASAIHQ